MAGVDEQGTKLRGRDVECEYECEYEYGRRNEGTLGRTRDNQVSNGNQDVT
jgi:hypothetical protein